MNQIKTPSQRCMQMWPAGAEDRRWGDGEVWGLEGVLLILLFSSNLISCGSQCTAVQREGRNGSHPPSIIAPHVSAVSGFVSAPPPLFITHRTGGEVRFRGSNCVYLPEKHTGWQLHVRWRCSAIKLHYTLDTLAIGMSFSLTTGRFG